MIEELTQTEETLLALLRLPHDQTAVSLSTPAATLTHELLQTAVANQVADTIAFLVAHQIGWENVPPEWRTEHDKTHARISAYLAELDKIAATLAQANIPLVALKNSGIVRGIYPHPGAVPMGDIDVLVRQADFRRAHQIMLDNGFQFEFRSELEEAKLEEAEQGGGAEYWKILASGDKMWFELQWRPVAGRWIQPHQEPAATDLMARAIPLEKTAVKLLAPEDNLLQVCLHTAKHSYVRAPGFRLHLDVERIVRAYPALQWQTFIDRVTELNVKTAAYFSLAIPRQLFHTPVPETVLKTLKPASWKEKLIWRLIHQAGIFNPDEKKFSRLSYIFFTTLLFDDGETLWRGIFPDPEQMQSRYNFQSKLMLPYFHLRRLGHLLFQRLAT